MAGFDTLSGAFSSDNRTIWGDYNDIVRINPAGFTFNAARSNPIYGASDTVQPPAIQLIPQIRY